jgi:peptidoglycan/xylan/chitin deacetylase (PgdA/CDA1 family)
MVFEGLHVRASELDAHCKLLAETCHPITLDQWRASLHGGPPLPPRPVLVTFDDGYRTVATVARPILERYGIPALLFVCSTPIEERTLFLHDAIARHSGEAAAESFKSAPYASWQEALRTNVMTVPAEDPQSVLTVAELQLLAQKGFEIGNHTSAHGTLSRSPRQRQWDEIATNHAALREWIDAPRAAFAYPFGQPSDYSAETQEILREHGYEFAFTTNAGFATGHPGLECPRFVMLSGIAAAELAHRLAYSWHPAAPDRVVFGAVRYFFAGARRRSSSNQLVTTAKTAPVPTGAVCSTRKCSPSGATSHVVPGVYRNSSFGAPIVKAGVVCTATDISPALPGDAVQ